MERMRLSLYVGLNRPSLEKGIPVLVRVPKFTRKVLVHIFREPGRYRKTVSDPGRYGSGRSVDRPIVVETVVGARPKLPVLSAAQKAGSRENETKKPYNRQPEATFFAGARAAAAAMPGANMIE